MRMNRLALGLPFLSVSLLAFVACTVTTNEDNNVPDGSAPGADAGTSSSGDAANTDSGATGDASLLGFVPSNLGSALAGIDTTALGDMVLTGEQVFDTVTPTCPGQPCLAKTFTAANGATVGLFVAKTWKIDTGAHVTVRAGNPIVLVALQTIDIEGALDDGAITDRGADFGFPSPFGGAGTGAGGPGSNGPGGSVSSGAGGGAYCGAGGRGGNLTGTNGNPGVKYGGPTLIPLIGGSKGGTGAGAGGAGGGAVELVAGTSITVGATGLINANGGGAGPGGSVSTGQAAGGGGSGGGILLEAPAITIAGTIVANGGGGGGNGGATSSASTGQDGEKSATAALGGNATKDPAGGGVAGGNGAAGASIDGTDGDAPNVNYSAGGGGGGAGYIRLNTTAGAATITGTLSPALGTCSTQGTLAH